jgi:hypothetical protein
MKVDDDRNMNDMPARLLATLILSLCGLFASTLTHAAENAPNIVIILADDMGWNDVGYHGSEISTPHIDRLAAEGLELDRFYAQPACSPTRAALLTGKSSQALGIYSPLSKLNPTGLPLTEKLMPAYFRDAGYQTFLVGKWHLGFREPAYRPTARGFDHFYGHLTGGIGFWDHVHGGGLDWQRNGETVREEGYSTHLMAAEIDRLIAQRDPSKPMFLYAAFNAPHLPNEAPEETIAQYAHIDDPNRRVHAAMVSELDTAIGQLLATLDEQGMLENTLVLRLWFVGPGASKTGLVDPCLLPCWSLFAPTHWTAAVTTNPSAKVRNPSTKAVRASPQFFTGKGKFHPLVVRRWLLFVMCCRPCWRRPVCLMTTAPQGLSLIFTAQTNG